MLPGFQRVERGRGAEERAEIVDDVVDMAAISAVGAPLGRVAHPCGGHAERSGRNQVSGNVFDHQRGAGRHVVPSQQFMIAGECRLRLVPRIRNVDNAAERAGKLDQFKNADKVYRQFMRDFYDKNAPLKGVLDYRQGMTGKTLRSLIKPSNVNRAQEALGRWGLKDQAEALKKIADMPDPNESIGSMEKLSTSEKGFTQTRLEAAREADAKRVAESRTALQAERSKRLKMLGLTGGAAGTLYEGYRLLNK